MAPDVHLVVAAHPDDEAIGAGITLADAPLAYVAYLTDGAAARETADLPFADRGAYARERLEEGRRAMGLVGVAPDRVFALGGADQGSSLQMGSLAVRLAWLVERLNVTMVVAHPYEGGHPDHDAAALCAHAAAALGARRGRRPALLEFTSYHADTTAGAWRRGSFLHPNRAVAGRCPEPRLRMLTERERRLKRRMIACYRSQATVLAPFPVDAEITREAPRYHFLEAPHDGALLYEGQPWGMTGQRWRALARDALAGLGLDPAEAW
jgi:LmbE family N-acetylglucosaminyl deacetylase